MAHYKRKRSRIQPSGYYSGNALKHRLGERHHDSAWLSNWPRHWDKVYHTRPARARTHHLEQAIILGADPDNMIWPDGRRPHIYYW